MMLERKRILSINPETAVIRRIEWELFSLKRTIAMVIRILQIIAIMDHLLDEILYRPEANAFNRGS
jgi:hypothetical protein